MTILNRDAWVETVTIFAPLGYGLAIILLGVGLGATLELLFR